MKKVLIFIFVSISFLCQAQICKIDNKRSNESIELDKLEEFLVAGIKFDTVSNLQNATIFIKVTNGNKIDYLTVVGNLNKKFQNIIEGNIYNKNAPWLKKNKRKTVWYVLPVVFGHVNLYQNERQIYSHILDDEVSIYSLRELIRDFPQKVFILLPFKRLSNHGMETILL